MEKKILEQILSLQRKIDELEQRFQSDMKDHWQMMGDIVTELNKIKKEAKRGS